MPAPDKRFQCPDCGWVGTEDQMLADATGSGPDEAWSNWICPQCSTWWRLEDYVPVGKDNRPERQKGA